MSRSEQAKAATQEILRGENVLVASESTYSRGLSALSMLYAIPIVGMFMQRASKKRSHDLPQQFILALTDQRIVAIGQPKANWNVKTVKATKELKAFPREGASATVTSAVNGGTLELNLADGRDFSALVLDRDVAEQMAELI